MLYLLGCMLCSLYIASVILSWRSFLHMGSSIVRADTSTTLGIHNGFRWIQKEHSFSQKKFCLFFSRVGMGLFCNSSSVGIDFLHSFMSGLPQLAVLEQFISMIGQALLKNHSNTFAEASVARGCVGKPYPHSSYSWKVTDKDFFL